MTKHKKGKPTWRLAWAGFLDGKIDNSFVPFGDETLKTLSVFPTRAAARRVYDDVRRVAVREVKP